MESMISYQDEISDRISKAMANFRKSPKERITQIYVEGRLELLEQMWSEFRVGHKELLQTIDKTVLKAQDYMKKDVYNTTEEVYMDYKCGLRGIMVKLQSVNINKSNESNGTNCEQSHIRLPKISIPSFSGKYTEWITFRDLFTSLIHNNKMLDNVQKLHYLKGCLTGEAEQLIRYTPVTDANYATCWKQLVERYSNKKLLSHTILKRLLSQRSASFESASYLKELLDTSTDCLSALTNLGIDVSSWDIIIIYLLSSKLDPESRKQWELTVTSNVNPDALPTFKEFKDFLSSRYRALEFLEPGNSRNKNVYERSTTSSTNNSKTFYVNDAANIVCEFCSDNHKLCFCKKFAAEDYEKRHEFVANNRICYNCLGANHSVRFCQKTINCRICNKRHHSLLHPKGIKTSTAHVGNVDQAAVAPSEKISDLDTASGRSSEDSTPQVSLFAKGKINHQVLLATALVKAKSKTGQFQVYRALLDQGSQASFVTEATAQGLGLKKIPVNGIISGLGGEQMSVTTKYMVTLRVTSLIDQEFEMELNAYVLPNITSYLPAHRVSATEWVEMQQLVLADPGYGTPNKIDMLLGAEVYAQILKDGVKRGPVGTPIAQSTAFGWVLSGQVGSASSDRREIVLHTHMDNDNEMIKRFWEMESDPSLNFKKMRTTEEQRCEDIFAATTTRDVLGRYVVKLPFRDEDPLCKGGNSREIAIRRFKSLEKKFSQNKDFKEKYTAVVKEYLQLDHMTLVSASEKNTENSVYLPHHAVIREDKSTSKVRVVFDASCKNENGTSLNDTLMTGPTLQPELRHLIMQWRIHPVCLIADIVKMYRMVRVTDEDANYQRIVWRDNQEAEIQDYKLLTVTFGTASAPYLAVKALNQVAIDYMNEYPTAAKIVAQGFYMDDLMTGCQTAEEGVNLYKEMKDLLMKGGFILQKWASNSEKLQECIVQREEGEYEERNLEIKHDKIVKILGLTWNKTKDEFQYSVKLPVVSAPVTKRKIISDVARLFDPLGWIAPCVIKAKAFIQRLWIAGVEWDEEPSKEILKDWCTYRKELSQLSGFAIPRWLHTQKDDQLVELHGFSDASNIAFGAVVYLRVINSSGDINVQLVAAKTKVAPVKQVSIPRLELCGAVLLSKLLSEVSEVLNISKNNMRAWTDSTVVLAWLNKHPSNWKTFVANRVSEILCLLEPSQWSHVSTKENPADCASRGVRPVEFIGNLLWLNGPEFLKEKVILYKKPADNETHLEKSIKTHHGALNECILNKYSSLRKLIRVIAFCRRFLHRSDTGHQVRERGKHLSPTELNAALISCIKIAQSNEFRLELSEIAKQGCIKTKSSKIFSFTPFLDTDGVLRVGGRLAHSDEMENFKHPMLLPHNSPLSRLLVADAHERTLHGGDKLMLNYLRTAYCIVGAKTLVKNYVRKCITCVRNKAKTQTQLMGSLPQVRITPARPFSRSGVDYAGPIYLRTSKGRGHKAYKAYICLFVCMVTRAVHIDVVSELTSRGFIETFKRFVSRRGYCSELYSDNGTNFVGAARELKDLFLSEKSVMVTEIAEALATQGTTWHFIPPRAPNFGGLWEAGIKSTKFHIKRVIGEATLTYEEMATLLSQIEACLNSRPISVLPADPSDPNPLTPGHFLVGEPLITIPEVNYEHSSITSLKRWQMTQRMLQCFWRRWSNEYLVHLLHRYKWAIKTPEPEVGDIVLVKEDNLPPTKWLFGRIVQKHPGADNLSRVVSLKCGNSIIKRPTSKLCILPVSS